MAVLVAASASAQPVDAAIPQDAAVISNSGSTNTAPYRIIVRPDGTARVQVAQQDSGMKRLSRETTQALFADLRAAMPLDAIKTVPCMKSASFGTSTHVRYKGSQSPDLSCALGTAADRLSADVAKLIQEIGITGLRQYGGLRSTHIVPAATPPPKD